MDRPWLVDLELVRAELDRSTLDQRLVVRSVMDERGVGRSVVDKIERLDGRLLDRQELDQ